MHYMFRREFWGFVLIAIGFLLVGNLYFGLNIPVFGTIVAILLIAWGLGILAGRNRYGWTSDHDIAFGEGKLTGSAGQRHYNLMFGRALVDWSKMTPKGKGDPLDSSTAFGESIIRIDPKVPMLIRASAMFGEARLPDGSSVAFGERTYATKVYKPGAPHFAARVSVVFGSTKIIED